MGKYEPLKEFLEAQERDRVPMTFTEIEKVLGDKLPASKNSRAWWSNNPANNVMTREWLEAGFRAEAVDLESGKLVFVRETRRSPSKAAATVPDQKRRRHPAFGCMKGMLTIPPGVDLTEPVLPEWGEYAEKKYGPGGKLYEE